MLDGIVQTLAREAQRYERRSKKGPLKPRDLSLLVTVAGAVTKVVEQQSNPFGATFQARLRKMSDGQIEQLKSTLQQERSS